MRVQIQKSIYCVERVTTNNVLWSLYFIGHKRDPVKMLVPLKMSITVWATENEHYKLY